MSPPLFENSFFSYSAPGSFALMVSFYDYNREREREREREAGNEKMEFSQPE